LWWDKNWDENLWWITTGEIPGQYHCWEGVDIPVHGKDMFRTTASGCAMNLTLFIWTFRGKNIKNVKRYFYS
jgi:hypothetical protein